MKLNKNQKKAVQELEQNLLVSAGAGTGKTRVLVERFINLVTNQKSLVTEILTLTFTDKAAAEMKKRILDGFKALGMEKARRDLESAYISTIHSFASRVLKEHPLEAGVDPDFGVMEEEEAELLKHQALDQVIEAGCIAGDGTFELLRQYSEKEIRDGILKVHRAARVEGKSIEQFFTDARAWAEQFMPGGSYDRKNQTRIGELLAELQESDLSSDWKKFLKCAWDDPSRQDFAEWFKPFSRKGGKETKPLWKELSESCKTHLAILREQKAAAYRPVFEKTAIVYETFYESLKKSETSLDFDDLEIKALGLFTKNHPANQKIAARYRKHFKFIMVDEFQDTNPLQIRLLEALSQTANLFYVGDYKQSIYGFRGTSPKAFLEKEITYRQAEAGTLIALDENFRSHDNVLQFVNTFFEAVWEEDGFEFEKLKTGTTEKHEEPGVELLLTSIEEEESLDHARMREASMLAARLLEIHETQNQSWGDMAVLFEATTATPIYEQAFKKAGIPYYVVSGRGFYHQPEIRDMMSFLGCLENPMSDIDLAASLRSPLFQVSNDTLFWLAKTAKENDEYAPLYHGLKALETIPQISDAQKEKLRFFISMFENLRAEKDRLRLAELLDRILEETSYELCVLADAEGARRYANLKKLLELAREYEARQIVPLGSFIATIKGLETREIREAEAQTETEQGGRAVRLMTVHKAKGLEFSVVALADLSHRSQSRESKTFMAESGSGYSFKVRDFEEGEEPEATLSWSKISEKIEAREAEEWKRLFYVAMTRAKSRLILSGTYKPKKEAKEKFSEMGTWMEWVMTLKEEIPGLEVRENTKHAAVSGRPRLVPFETKDFQEILKLEGGSSKVEGKRESVTLRPSTLDPRAAQIILQTQAIGLTGPKTLDLPVSAYALFQKDPLEWQRVYQFGYPGGYALELAGQEIDFNPKEIQKADPWEDTTPADFGTAVHAFLENLDFKNPSKNFETELLQAFRGMEPHRVEQAREMSQKFIQSKTFREIQNARQVYRELPFILNERHGKIQGVIDLLFQNAKGDWIILDYKTGEGSAEKVKREGYDLQIQIYALAVSVILNALPGSGVLYFFKNQLMHEVPLGAKVVNDCQREVRRLQDEMIRRSCENLNKMV